MIGLYVCVYVCLSVSPLVRFGQLFAMQINAFNLMKVNIERNNLQLELTR